MKQDDDAGIIHVFEAVIVGVLVLTAILFLTGLSAPSASQGGTALDLGRIAGDTLSILEAREPDDTTNYDNKLEEIVDTAMKGDPNGETDTWMREVLPVGTRYLLRIDNGIEPLTLLPAGTGPDTLPRRAQAAETILLPDWRAHAGAATPLRHGDELPNGIDIDACPPAMAPTGAIQGPGGSWHALWGAGATTVPPWAPYGVWECGADSFRVVPPNGVATDYAVYAVQLVVWPGA